MTDVSPEMRSIRGHVSSIRYKTFTGEKIIPAHIYNSMIFIYEMGGLFSHQYLEETDVSPYALQSVAMALCEVLYWFRSYIEDHEK